jgi:hypothetical protein
MDRCSIDEKRLYVDIVKIDDEFSLGLLMFLKKLLRGTNATAGAPEIGSISSHLAVRTGARSFEYPHVGGEEL